MRFFKIDQHYWLPGEGVKVWATVGFYEPESGVEICVIDGEPSGILVSREECGYRKFVLKPSNGTRAVPITGDTMSLEAVVEEYIRDQSGRKAESALPLSPGSDALLERTINAASRVSLALLQLTFALHHLSDNYAYQMLRSNGDVQIICLSAG